MTSRLSRARAEPNERCECKHPLSAPRAPRGAAAHAPRRTAGAPQRPRATRRLRGEDPQPCSTGSRFKRHQSPRASLLAPPRTPHALDAPRTTAQLDGRRCVRILSLAQTSRSSAHPAASKFDAWTVDLSLPRSPPTHASALFRKARPTSHAALLALGDMGHRCAWTSASAMTLRV